jgi:UDP-N-acetylmuramate: L-alanyl-gamma-D-glutamyl-meso-diaminopimelate ligase
MAAGAALMKEKGYHVTGSDAGVYPPMSLYLEGEGIPFATAFEPSNLVPCPDLVVIGNAISRGNPEVEAVLDLRVPYISLPELLKAELIHGKRSSVVTGTHGKTTSTSLLAWVLESSGRDPSFFVGGVPLNFGRGIKWAGGRDVVLEGDEYDTAFFDKRPKFLHYMPDLVIINNIEFDHADIYRDLSDIQKVFENLKRLIPRRGLIVANRDEPAVRDLLEQAFCPVEWFGHKMEAPWHIGDIEPEGESTAFTLHHNHESIGRLRLPLMGEHNVLNAAGVYVSCHWLGLTHREIGRGFETFRGVSRRMEKVGIFRGVTVFDDFAHHPTAISKTIAAIEHHHPGHRIWAVFEPRTNTTRRNLFQRELIGAFQRASQVIIGPVYRQESIEPSFRLNPLDLARDIEKGSSTQARHIPEVDAIVAFLSCHVRKEEIIVVMSNGGFGGLVHKLVRRLQEPR